MLIRGAVLHQFLCIVLKGTQVAVKGIEFFNVDDLAGLSGARELYVDVAKLIGS